MKKTWLILLVINICIGLVVFWLYSQLKTGKETQEAQVAKVPQTAQSLQYPYFPETEMFLDDEKTWQLKRFQPFLKEFIEVDLNNFYLVVSYSTSENEAMEEGKIYLGRMVEYVNSEGQKTVIESLKLKEELKPGDRFGVNYLAKFPADFSTSPRCKINTIECLWAFRKQESDAQGDKIFYPLLVYRNLKQ